MSVVAAEDETKINSRSLYLHTDYALALSAALVLNRVTGDYCGIIRMGLLFRVVRIDPSGKEVR